MNAGYILNEKLICDNEIESHGESQHRADGYSLIIMLGIWGFV